MEESPRNFHTENVNIRKCVEEIKNDLSFKLEERGIKMEIDITGSLVIKGSYMLIYSLFKNLIDNSIDHGGEKIEIVIKSTGVSDGIAYFKLQRHRQKVYRRVIFREYLRGFTE